jgi:hypothetical protein
MGCDLTAIGDYKIMENLITHYEINVSKNGKHLFATHERSLERRFEVLTVYNLFVQKFPVSEGYTISVSGWSNTGIILTEKFEKGEFSV